MTNGIETRVAFGLGYRLYFTRRQGILIVMLALGDVARARGMAQVAKDVGLERERLYKALAPGAKPRFDTALKVAKALGVRLTAQAA